MNLPEGLSHRRQLRWLVEHVASGDVTVASFCQSFEAIYNLELDKSSLSESEATAFAALFKKVAWYSPYADEREQVPNYLGEDGILDAARTALAEMGPG